MKREDDEFNALNTRLSNTKNSKQRPSKTSKCEICGTEFPHIDLKAKSCSKKCKAEQRARRAKERYENIKAGTHIPRKRGPIMPKRRTTSQRSVEG